MKKVISVFLLLFMVMGFMPVYANPVDGGGNSGGGNAGGTVTASTWKQVQSGYRITVVDKNKQVVATTVDFVFSAPNQYFGEGGKYWYTNSRFSSLSSDGSNYTYVTFDELLQDKQLDKVPQYPIYWKGGTGYAGGEQFKEWFLNGKYGMDLTRVPVRPPVTSSSPKNEETGTTRPVSGSPGYQTTPGNNSTGYTHESDQTGGYRGGALATDVSGRNAIRLGAIPILTRQGYLTDANAYASMVYKSADTQFKTRMAERTSSREAIINEIVGNIVSLSKIYGRSVAEQNYILAVALDRFLGVNATPSSSSRLRVSGGLRLDRVPASGANDYYIDEIMNSKVAGKYVFQFNGKSVTNRDGMNTSTDPLEFIQRNNFYVVVEPIFWFMPAQIKDGKKINEQSYYLYGTVNNIADHSKNVLGWDFGGYYQSLTNALGWSSMYMGNDWKDQDGNILLKGVSRTGKFNSSAKSHTLLREWIEDGYAIATHVYRTSVEDTQVTGFDTWNTPTRAPDPKDLKVRSGDTKKYNIVKYYEEEENGVVVHRYAPLYRSSNPPSIDIVDELAYWVSDWFITNSNVTSGAPATYSGAKSTYSATRSGRDTRNVRLGGSELTLVVKLSNIETDLTTPLGVDFEVEIPESKISVYKGDLFGDRFRRYDLPVFDRILSYTLRNTENTDSRVEANTSVWKPTLSGNTLRGNGGRLTNIRYSTVVHRGYDDLTLYAPHVSTTSPLRGMYNRYATSPVGDRGMMGVQNVPLRFNFSLQGTVGLSEDEKGSLSDQRLDGVVKVKTYRGLRDGKAIGNVFDGAEKTGLGMTVAGINGNNGVGKMLKNSTRIQFYPYIRMTYQAPGSTNNLDAYVASQWLSVVEPNDFVEVNWGKSAVDNLGVSSNQWSLHTRAINGGQSWNGRNQVLPGGAIYELNSLNTAVGVVTWQTIVSDDMRRRLAMEIPANEYSLDRARALHGGLVEQAEDRFTGMKVYQWVNADPNATNAWTNNNKAVKVEPGVSLAPLGLNTRASADTKYQLNGDSDKHRELSVLGVSKNSDVFYKVFSDTSGNIYMAKAIGSMEILKDVNGFRTKKSGVEVTRVATKGVKATDLAATLSGDAKALDERTKIITNFVTALERNTGNDRSASWASDGKWYNEAFDGIYVVRQQTNIQVGLDGKKILALDPNLTPSSSGKADLYTKAFVSQYRADTGGSDVLGEFRGETIRLDNMANIFSSKKFYIPNALVTDGY